MKHTITLIAALLLSNFCNAQRLVSSYYDWNKIHPHEQYYVNGAGQKNGTYKEYNENGVVIREYNYVNGLENGVCVDYAASTNNQRVIASKGTFKNGELDGPYVQYCKLDYYKSKSEEGQYKTGRKSGLYKVWWCSEIYDKIYTGALKSIGSYADDNKIGEWKEYYSNGRLLSKGSYISGRENGFWVYYNINDSTKPFSFGTYINGTRVGKWVVPINERNEIADIKEATAYSVRYFDSAGVLTPDLVTDYYMTGEKYREVHLNSKGKETGLETTYYQSNGAVWTKWNYDTGSFQKYYENGKMMWEGMKSGERQIGTWKGYYESGKLKREQTYNEYGRIASYIDYDESGSVVKRNTVHQGEE